MSEIKMHGLRARLDYILKHNYLFNRIFSFSISFGLKAMGIFIPTDPKMVLFSAHSRRYNDSPRAIYEYMINRYHAFKDMKYVWALEDISLASQIPGRPIVVKADTFKYFYYALKSKFWITCVNIERGLHFKKKKCRYLNTWHGTPLKTIGNDAGGRKGYDFSSMDLFCYASEYEKEISKRAFNVKDSSLIPTGLPRNDTLYNTTQKEIEEIKKRLSIPLDKKVILYAPTWRDSTDGGKSCSLAPPVTPDLWERELKNEYVVLFRMHAYTNKLIGINFNEVMRDYSEYPDINDLFKVSDILISDYSASIVDFSILERPILCFAYDYEDYKRERGLYLDFNTAMPSGIIKSELELLNYIKNIDYRFECDKTRRMLKSKLLTYGGNATEECVRMLFKDYE